MERELKLIPKKEMHLSNLSLETQGRMTQLENSFSHLADCILAQRAGANITS